jgi:hypothetical protein
MQLRTFPAVEHCCSCAYCTTNCCNNIVLAAVTAHLVLCLQLLQLLAGLLLCLLLLPQLSLQPAATLLPAAQLLSQLLHLQ